MVLLVPDDMPAGATTLEGNVEEMRALYKDWDPRYGNPFFFVFFSSPWPNDAAAEYET